MIIHISIEGLEIMNAATGKAMEVIRHLPIARQSMVESMTEMIGARGALLDYEGGYQNWKEAFESGRGGVFTISILDAVEYVESAMNQV